ncbi:CRISPR-associated protein Cas5 [Skermanella pratensis]|uniref:CRISPR-associated protein Cas5 n=1 Tax=Skermanella pratensis TaxID=2233999 RepID=UPI0013018716|nr:CRISPR-associated protein Cas5 [Skermanella pratensis]
MSSYPISIEVSGPLAMFARPDTGVTPTSYPVPTWSAAKGILESIAALERGAAIHPIRIEICRRKGEAGGEVHFQKYATNYGGPLRKRGQFNSGSSFQFFATVLADVCYRIHAEVRRSGSSPDRNPPHHLQELFNRRLAQGRCHQTPALGWKEFTCSYWGAFRESEYEVDTALDLLVPSMLVGMWSNASHGKYQPRFAQNVSVERGVLSFAE